MGIQHASDLIESIRSRWAQGQLVGGLSAKQVKYLESLAIADGFSAIDRGVWMTSAPCTGGDYVSKDGIVTHWLVRVNNAGNGRLEITERRPELIVNNDYDSF